MSLNASHRNVNSLIKKKYILIVVLVGLVCSFFFYNNGIQTLSYTAYASDFSSAPVQGEHIVFDESHLPYWSNNITLQYNNFSTDMIAQGYTVEAMSTWDPATIMGADVFVTVTPSLAYSATELALLHDFVAHGGGLFIIGDRYNVGADIANYFDVTLSNDPLADEDDYYAVDYWIIWNRTANFGHHPITAGVTRVETYYGDGLVLYPMHGVPILITDADDHSRWDMGGGVASGIAGIVAFEYELGLGRIVVTGDGDLWTSADTDSDGTFNYFDGDNEILARNIVHWLAHPNIPMKIVVFDESHTPFNSIDETPTQINVLFDETHAAWNGIDDNDNNIYGYEDDGSGFGDFAQILEGAGYGVDKMTVWSSLTIGANDVLVFVRPSMDYTANELNTIEGYVIQGGSVLIIGESTSFLTNAVYQLARTFGCDFYDGVTNDSDDYNTYDYWPIFSDTNLANHPILNGIDEVNFLHSTAFNETPVNAIPLIRTDDDATAGWYTTPTGNPSPRNLPVAVAFTYGQGRVVITTDMSHWYNDTSNGLLALSHNGLFGINVVRWLGEAGFNIGTFYDMAHILRGAGYGIKAMRAFNPDFMATADAVIIGGEAIQYSPSERASIQDYVEVTGRSIFLIGDGSMYLGYTSEIAEDFGIRFDYVGFLLDSDDYFGEPFFVTTDVIYDITNFATHPITTGLNQIIIAGATGINNQPGSATTLVHTDDDATSMWWNATAAPTYPVMSALTPNRGRLVAIGASWQFTRRILTSPLHGDNKTMIIDYYDTKDLLLNTMGWLTSNRAPLVTLVQPNGGENINGTYTIQWTHDDYDGQPLTTDLFYSFDNGSTWHPIVTGLDNTSYTWNTIGLPNSDQYRIRVVVSDGDLTTEAISTNSFTVFNFILLPDIPWPLIIAVVVIIIVVIIVLVLVLRRRGSSK
jgi:uncharacterized membrane protein